MYSNLLFPTHCLICKRYGAYICSHCYNRIPKAIPECYICRRVSKGYTTHDRCIENDSLISKVYIGWEYTSQSSNIIKGIKYQKATSIYPVISHLIDDRIKSITTFFKPYSKHTTALLPIPMHLNKQRKRGFNQALDIAKIIQSKIGIDVLENAVTKVVDTKPQAEKSAEMRVTSEAEKIYEIDIGRFKSIQNIVLIDDVVTTGTTLRNIAKPIRSALPEVEVSAFALFRAQTKKGRRI